MCKYIPARVSATNSRVVFSRETERMEVEKIYRLSEAAALQVRIIHIIRRSSPFRSRPLYMKRGRREDSLFS